MTLTKNEYEDKNRDEDLTSGTYFVIRESSNAADTLLYLVGMRGAQLLKLAMWLNDGLSLDWSIGR